MRKRYSLSKRAEVIADAVVTGAESTAIAHGLDVRTVRAWLATSGKAPAAEVNPEGWRSLMDLALSKVNVALVGGHVRPKDAAVIAAIASRNIREPAPPAEPRTPEDEAYDAFVTELEARYPEPHLEHLALVALIRCPEPPADRWAYLESLGDLEAWDAQRRIDDHARLDAQLAANRSAAEAAQVAALDAETQALVAAAEAWLEAANDAA
jgi:hypothetical protein